MLVEGNSDKKIFNETNENDLIILGPDGISIIDRVFRRSLNEKLLHNAKSTIMIFR